MRRRVALACVAVTFLALSVARRGHDPATAAPPVAAPTSSLPLVATPDVVASCPAVPGAGEAWPVGSLRSLPVVAGSVISSVVRAQGTLEVQFGVPTSFKLAALALTGDLTASGFALVGGDYESKEQDVGFLNGALTGRVKFISIGPCLSRGVLSVVDPDAAAS